METQAPTKSSLAIMVVFALSCFGLLMFIWTAFGGPVPLKPEGYRVNIAFAEATQLALQADVRISGVSVGKVVKTEPTEGSEGRTRAEIQIEPEYSPLPRDTKAILRLKTLLGETYVELTPGNRRGGNIPEGGTLPNGQVQSTVELDEILRTFDEGTRTDLRQWVTSWAASLKGRGGDLNDAIGNLPGLAEDSTATLGVLHSHQDAVSRLVRDSGTVFSAIGRRESAVRTLITAGDAVFATTAARNRELADTIGILPTFLREARATLLTAETTAAQAAPVVRALKPVAPLLTPTLRNGAAIAPDLERLFRELDPVISLSRPALPAATRLVKAVGPLVDVLYPVGRDLVPVSQYLGLYKQEVVTAFTKIAAATEAEETPPGATKPTKYVRVAIPVTNEAFVNQAARLPSNRHNAYLAPRGLDRLAQGLHSFSCSHLGNPQTIPVIGFGAPPCIVQTPPPFQGRADAFPHLEADGP